MKIKCDYFNSRKRIREYISNEPFDKLDLSDCEIRSRGSIEISPKWIKWGKDYFPRAFVAGVEYRGPGIGFGVESDVNQGTAELALLDGRLSKAVVMSTSATGFNLGTYGNTTDEYYLRFREKVDPYAHFSPLSWFRYRTGFAKECKSIWDKYVATEKTLLSIYDDVNRESDILNDVITEQTIAAIYAWWKDMVNNIKIHVENRGKNYFAYDDEHCIGSDELTIRISKGLSREIIITKQNGSKLVKERVLNDTRYTERNFGKCMDGLLHEFEINEL